MKLVLLLAACTDHLVDSIPYTYVSCLLSPEFRSGLLNSYFFKLALGSDCLELFSGQSLSKVSKLIDITKISVAFKPELQSKFEAYAVCKFNP